MNSKQQIPAQNNVDFWRKLAPHLTISDVRQPCKPLAFTADTLAEVSEQFHDEGYLCLPRIFDASSLMPIHQGIEALARSGFPPVFIYLYDQPYALFAKLTELISHFLAPQFGLLPNFWAWNISPTAGARGWPPHQDCQAKTRFSDGAGGETLISMSLWVPLTAATLENGCMSVLPRSAEDHYDLPLVDVDAIDPDDAVALPVEAGSVLAWSQDLYHWSNRVTGAAEGRRVSVSFEFQNQAFDPLAKPLLEVCSPPAFDQRLHLVRQQISKYRHMEDINFSIDGIGDRLTFSP